MLRRILMVALLVTLGASGRGDEPKPGEKKSGNVKLDFDKIPDGWHLVKAKDGSHGFLLPKELAGEESSTGNFKAEGFTGKKQIVTATLNDGRVFVVVQIYLGGPATKEMKINDVYDLFYDADKSEPGTKISEPKPIAMVIGGVKGREYFVTEKGEAKRIVTVVVKGRVLQLIAAADKRDKLTDKDAETFLTSLVLYAPKKPADKPPEKKDN